jgi:hypothetical protein
MKDMKLGVIRMGPDHSPYHQCVYIIPQDSTKDFDAFGKLMKEARNSKEYTYAMGALDKKFGTFILKANGIDGLLCAFPDK